MALSVEGDPSNKKELHQLVRMAKGAVSLGKDQIARDDVELQALASFANVIDENGKLKIDLALPADDLFDKLRLPCPGRADTGTQ